MKIKSYLRSIYRRTCIALLSLSLALSGGALAEGSQEWIPAAPKAELKRWMLGPWTKLSQPILQPNQNPEAVDSRNIYNMATLVIDDVVHMIYRAESLQEPAKTMTGRLCWAVSNDGLDFKRLPEDANPRPTLVPTEPYEKMGVEDPRLILLEGTYYLTYSAWDGDKARLCLATSTDGQNWTKHGPLFPNFAPTNGWTKSGAILPRRMEDGPYKGKYLMYFGDTHIWLASSSDLIKWEAEEKPVFSPRPGKFDNVLVEPGPPPLWTEQGVLLIYNGAGRFPTSGEALIYAAGQILLDPKNPAQVLDRAEEPFLAVTQDWEREGYVDNVVFAEGLVEKEGRWLLYFGGADRVIGVATAPLQK